MNGSILQGKVNVCGWFLDKNGVSTIEVLIDGKSFGFAQYLFARPDVNNAFPQYENNNSGFQFTLDTGLLSNGEHILTIRETGTNGGVTTLNNIKVNVNNQQLKSIY